jgi:uncharacterized protein YbaP (TraB family)
MMKTAFSAVMLAAWAWCCAATAQTTAGPCPPQMQPPTQAQAQDAARVARDHGALWRITRNGTASYLFGTIHVGKLEWATPGPRLRAALAATDTIALEIDPTDPQMRMRMAGTNGNVPAPAIPTALAARLARRLDAACLPAQARPAIEGLHPVMQAVTLSVLEARWEGLDAGYGQEIALAGYGRAAQRQIVSLETPESQLAALLPTDGDEVRETIADMLDQLDKGATRRAISRLAQAWARGDLREIEQYEHWCECVLDDVDRKMLARLLDERNPVLAARIDALHRDGRKVLAAVGMLHMVGPNGLPALLRGRGFAVQRVPFH